MCPIFDNIKQACKFDYPNNAMKRHLLTYYKCKQYYEENEVKKKELNKILKERKIRST